MAQSNIKIQPIFFLFILSKTNYALTPIGTSKHRQITRNIPHTFLHKSKFSLKETSYERRTNSFRANVLVSVPISQYIPGTSRRSQISAIATKKGPGNHLLGKKSKIYEAAKNREKKNHTQHTPLSLRTARPVRT